MTQKVPNVASGTGNNFPQDAYAYFDDVKTDVVDSIRSERGVDVTQPHWKTLEALGQVVRP